MEKKESTAWGLWALGFCGCCGLHRCYLNRAGSGVLWFITGGVCGIGQCVDICLMSSMVATENAKLQVRHHHASHPETAPTVYVVAQPAVTTPLLKPEDTPPPTQVTVTSDMPPTYSYPPPYAPYPPPAYAMQQPMYAPQPVYAAQPPYTADPFLAPAPPSFYGMPPPQYGAPVSYDVQGDAQSKQQQIIPDPNTPTPPHDP
ncbi:hypothetical protein Pelo_3893 [Pelomyxa schiedti]|nr:hypothetical protein Pelo_3893 [Pelomyxa schiedti]